MSQHVFCVDKDALPDASAKANLSNMESEKFKMIANVHIENMVHILIIIFVKNNKLLKAKARGGKRPAKQQATPKSTPAFKNKKLFKTTKI